MTATLYALPHSPWSERAKWALDLCDVRYREVVYRSRVGEPAMRARMRKWRGRISVPVLFVGDAIVDDSVDIARFADQQTDARTLFPAGEPVHRWVTLADRMLAAGRRRTTRAVANDPDALRASLARALPGGGLLPAPVARETARWLLKKYADLDEDRDDETILADGLAQLADALAERDTLLDAFSFADIAMATGLQFVDPPASMRPHIAPEAWFHWRDPGLAEAYAQVFAWRDRMYTRR